MRKRQIIIPLTETSVKKLESDSLDEIDQIIYNINEQDFLILYHSKLFTLIMQTFPDIIIDDFEEEIINEEIKLKKVIELIKERNLPQILVNRLVFLFEQALLCKTGIYFYF